MKRWFSLIVALQTLFIIGEAAIYAVQAKSGREIVLQASPVDPRSLFMGNYMALEVGISRLDVAAVRNNARAEDWKEGDIVYVSVEAADPYARPVITSVHRNFAEQQGDAVLRGVITRVERAGGPGSPITAVRVDYGINRFYFDASRQDELQGWMRRTDGRPTDMSVTVSVPASGRPILRALHINGRAVAGK